MPQKKNAEADIPLVLIDANVWVSAFINPSGYPAKIIDLWILKEKIEVVTSMPLLKEIAEVLQKPRLQKKYGYANSEIEKYLTLITAGTTIIEISGSISLCRDPKDNHLLETAIKGKAKYLITRDDDIKGDSELVSRMSKQNVRVITVSNFLKKYG